MVGFWVFGGWEERRFKLRRFGGSEGVRWEESWEEGVEVVIRRKFFVK